MKLIRGIVVANLLGVALTSAVPKPVSCFMIIRATPAAACPCCKNVPMPACQMKAQPPQDLITNPSPLPDFSSKKVVFYVAVDAFHAVQNMKHQLISFKEQLKKILIPTLSLTRGPPLNIHQLFA